VNDSEKDTESPVAAATPNQRAEEGKKAMAEYEAAALAIRAKTERLRALRLARDAELAKQAPTKPAAKRKTGTKSASAAAKRAAGTLSDWLDAQERGGHRA
jgi:hypothetical protein